MKKLLALVLSIMLVMTMATTAFATTVKAPAPTYTITINNEVTGHTYEAYQFFSGELTTVSEADILANIEWGSAIAADKGTELLGKIDAQPELSALHGAKSAAELADKLATVTSDSKTLDTFAKTINPYLTTVAAESQRVTNGYTISGLSAGYYLVKDKDGSLDPDAYDFYTKFILRVVKDQTVKPKGGVPDVTKGINDTLDGTYTDVKDFDISDTAYYKWTGSMPTMLNDYQEYYYKFVDELPVGITFNQIEQIYFANKAGENVHTVFDRRTMTGWPSGVGITQINHDGVFTRDENGKITDVTRLEKVELEFANLKALWVNLLPSHDIVVKYSARVTQDALIKTAMTNKVEVIYDNNPNGDGRGKTPSDEAHAFTFQIAVDKVDDSNDAKKLAGAEFVLYNQTGGNDGVTKHYAKVVTQDLVDQGTFTKANLGNVYGWTTNPDEATVLVTDSNGYFRVGGLDQGIFYLEETKAPAGYNLMENPVQVEIKAMYSQSNQTVNAIVSYFVDGIAQNTEVVKIRNSAGSTLPVTGGMGTTLFYVIGSILVLASAVMLITKRRMGVEG